MSKIFKSELDNNYVKVPNSVLSDTSLSLQAKGLLAHLLSLPTDWAINKTTLCDYHKNGRDGVISAWGELEAAGFIVSVRKSNNGKFLGWDHFVSAAPFSEEDKKNLPFTGKTVFGKTVYGKTEIGKTDYGESVTTNKDNTKKELDKERIEKEKEKRHSPTFLDFFIQYGRQDAKEQARVEWQKLSEQERMLAVENLEEWSERYSEKHEYADLPLAKNYLSGKRWEDVNEDW